MRLIKSIAAMLALLVMPLALSACNGAGGDAGNGATSAPVATAKPPAGKQWTDVVAKTGEGWYRQGNPDAPIKLIEYGSRSCPVCGAFAATGVEPLREKYVKTGQVSYEFRDFPVHPQDVGLSMLGRCVSTEAFFPILDQMYAMQVELNPEDKVREVYAQMANKPALEAAAGYAYGMHYADFLMQRGVSQKQIEGCLTQPALETFSKQIQEGQAKGVDGTPTFFVNNVKVSGPRWVDLEPALRAAGAH